MITRDIGAAGDLDFSRSLDRVLLTFKIILGIALSILDTLAQRRCASLSNSCWRPGNAYGKSGIGCSKKDKMTGVGNETSKAKSRIKIQCPAIGNSSVLKGRVGKYNVMGKAGETSSGAILKVSIHWFYWCRQQDSNPRPPDYKSGALPTELYRHCFSAEMQGHLMRSAI